MAYHFSRQETEFLIKHYPHHGPSFCVKELKMDKGKIRNKAIALGLKMTSAGKNIEMSSRESTIKKKEAFERYCKLSNPHFVYFLGYFWADGHIEAGPKNRIVFKTVTKDSEHAKKVLSFFPTDMEWKLNVSKNKNPDWQDSYTFKLSNKYLKDFLKSFGYENKSGGSAKLLFDNLSDEMKKYWIQGFFDGDGSIRDTGNDMTFCSCLNQNWDFLEEALGSVGVKFKVIRRVSAKSKNSTLIIDGMFNVFKLCLWLFSTDVDICMRRKKDRFSSSWERVDKMLRHPRTKEKDQLAELVSKHRL